jgi:histidine triad (HIT) family protein
MSTDALNPNCLFCKILTKTVEAPIVWEDRNVLVFLDHRPLFPGHCLVIPKTHLETIQDLPDDLLAMLFSTARLLAKSMEQGLQAEGAFIAANNRVSQSVPHFHIHVVPRRKGDGLKGFFWPRRKYKDEQEVGEVLAALQAAIRQANGKKDS